MQPDVEIKISNPKPVDRESKRGPSLALSVLFTLGMAAIVLPLALFIVAIALQWQGGLNFATFALKIGFYFVGAMLAYGFAVGVYHTFLAATGLDRG